MVVGKEDDEVKSSMGNMPSLLHEEHEDFPSSSSSPPPPQPASGQNDTQPEGTPINAERIEKFEAQAVDDASNRKSVTREEQQQEEEGEQTLRAAESNELPLSIELQLPAAGDKEDENESVEVVKEHRQFDSVDEASELRVRSESVEGKSDDLHVVNEVDDSRLNEDEGMEDGVEVKGEEDAQKKEEASKDPNLDNAAEQKEEIEKQDDTMDEMDTGKEDENGDKRDEVGADMEDENDDNRDEIEAEMENVNDDNRGELEAGKTHEKDECLDAGQIDEKKYECVTVADVSMLVSESEIGDVNAPALDAMAGVSKLENIAEEEKDGDVSMALTDSGLASKSDVVGEEEKDKIMNAIEPVSDDPTLAHKSDVIEVEEKDTDVAAPVVCDSALVRESTDTKKEEKGHSTPGNESKVDEEKDEDMSAQGKELPRSDLVPDKSEVGSESEQVTVKDDLDLEETEEEEGEGTPVLDKGVDIEAEAAGGGRSSGKRKRGRGAGAVGRPSTKKKMEEDVCFICFDGGDLVLCDRRGCPKAYHPSCVNRDEAFFQTKGRWNCGKLLYRSIVDSITV